MQFDDIIRSRRSIRKYAQAEVTDGQINELINAARLAPSGLNLQPWRFVVIRDEASRRKLSSVTTSPFAADAPVLLLCCADKAAFGSVPARIQELLQTGAFADAAMERFASTEPIGKAEVSNQWLRVQLAMYTAIAITHILLKATDLGLGGCWIGEFDEGKAAAIAGLTDRYIVEAIVTIGYADQQPQPRPRLPAEELMLKVI